jgi:hypothetical protein
MLVKSLTEMEAIVSKSPILSWDGWSVVELQRSEKGRTSAIGAYVNNKWHLKKVFNPTRMGWEIPNKYVI